MKLHPRKSALVLDRGKLRVRLMQANSGGNLLGRRRGFEGAELAKSPSEKQKAFFKDQLGRTCTGELAVLSFHPGVAAHAPMLKNLSKDRTIVTLGGRDPRTRRNHALIATGGKLLVQDKLSLSSEDMKAGIQAGDRLNLFSPGDDGAVRWAVLNCHDYTHPDLLEALLKAKVELLVVVACNNATRLYWEYATSDVHRLFCYVVIVNVGELGGSGVFVPFRRIGLEKNAKFGAGGQIFGTRGPAETEAEITLDIEGLRAERARFEQQGFAAIEKGGGDPVEAMVPPQHFMDTIDCKAGPPSFNGGVQRIELDWNSVNPRVAIGQLKSMDVDAYRSSQYRLHRAPGVKAFQDKLLSRLKAFETELAAEKAQLDFLVLPEVFAPRGFASRELTDFARRNRAIVIAGVDYPGESEDDNENSCAIIDRAGHVHWYRKITRSQYDAQTEGAGRMRMARGDTLYRFENGDGHSFGVLICYDFSHIDLVTALNKAGGGDLLDILFVVAHNPFSTLYRASCIADSHRFYQHVVMCNVADYGGSGVFVPMRRPGPRQVLMEIGIGAEAIGSVCLDLAEVRNARIAPDEALHSKRMMRKPGIFHGRLTPQ